MYHSTVGWREIQKRRKHQHLSWSALESFSPPPREGSVPSSEIPFNASGDGGCDAPANLPTACITGERIFIELMTSDRKLPVRAQNEGITGPKRLDDTRCTTYNEKGSLRIDANKATTYRGASLIRNCFLLGPCSRPMPRALWLS